MLRNSICFWEREVETGSSLACPQYHHLHRDQAHSRRISAITAPQTPRWRPPAPGDCAGQALTGTRRAALLGTCARARATRRHAPSPESPGNWRHVATCIILRRPGFVSCPLVKRQVTELATI